MNMSKPQSASDLMGFGEEKINSDLFRRDSLRTLVVDDNLVCRTKARSILETLGPCDEAENGIEAQELFLEAHDNGRPYDLITLDIGMPGLDGIETMRGLRIWEEFHDIPLGHGVKILMLSAHRSKEDILPAFNQGCDGYVTKPFDKRALFKALFSMKLDHQVPNSHLAAPR